MNKFELQPEDLIINDKTVPQRVEIAIGNPDDPKIYWTSLGKDNKDYNENVSQLIDAIIKDLQRVQKEL